MNLMNFDFYSLSYSVPAIILALSLHEFAHARVAYAFGDPTAKDAGRLTLNPMKHLDVLGTAMLILCQFGWAKPVPVNAYYFQGNRYRKMMYVAAAGPISNILQALLMAGLLSILFQLVIHTQNTFTGWLFSFLSFMIYINLVLAVFNLLPIPPLDGSKILAGLLPERHTHILFTLERYGMLILLAGMFLGIFGRIILPVVQVLYILILHLVGIS